MTPDTLDILWRYAGLRFFHVEALRDPESASPAMRRALRDGGLLDEAGGLTPAGRFALERAEEILAGRFREPAPLVEAPWEEIRGIGRRLPDAKCLHYIARHPGLALRFLRQTFGNAPLERLRSRGWIRVPEDLPWEAWSTPVEPTEEGLARLREAIRFVRAGSFWKTCSPSGYIASVERRRHDDGWGSDA